MSEPPDLATLRGRAARLTKREAEVFALLVDGLTTRALAARLGISAQTARIHRARVRTKLGVGTVPEMVQCARALGVHAPTSESQ